MNPVETSYVLTTQPPPRRIQIQLPNGVAIRQGIQPTINQPRTKSNVRIHTSEPVLLSVPTENQSPTPWWDGLAKALFGCLKRANSKMASLPSKVIPIAEKVHQRHLELEPLCCLSSCLVRGGCYAVVVFELVYILVTLCVVAVKVYDGGRLKFWEDLEPNFNAVVTHQLFLYVLVSFDILSSVMVLTLFRGLVAFERKYVKIHWRYDFLALVCLEFRRPTTWTLDNIVLMICFAGQIPCNYTLKGMARMNSESGRISGEVLFQQPYRSNAPTLIKGHFTGLEPNRSYWVGIVEYGNMTEGCASITAHHPTDHKHFRTPWAGTLGMVQQSRLRTHENYKMSLYGKNSIIGRGVILFDGPAASNNWSPSHSTTFKRNILACGVVGRLNPH
uniref:Superoxide dismutase copper/zinc binding domain-containing protein n=1 Tax=Ditylenchus dipsaci TaxID=166011 RepID=A0A915DI63_9BILA